jgi:hypothetical protein
MRTINEGSSRSHSPHAAENKGVAPPTIAKQLFERSGDKSSQTAFIPTEKQQQINYTHSQYATNYIPYSVTTTLQPQAVP